MGIDEARQQEATLHVELALRGHGERRLEGDDTSVGDRQIRVSGEIEAASPAENDVVHGVR